MLRGLVPADRAGNGGAHFHDQHGAGGHRAHSGVRRLPAIEGDCRIPGVPATGARIGLDFGDCAGAVSGELLPTGKPRDIIDLDGKSVPVSLVDAATAFVYVRATDIGARGTESAAEIAADAALQDKLEQVRGWAATVLGLANAPDEAKKASPNVPRVIMVAPSQDYAVPDGGKCARGRCRSLCAADVDAASAQGAGGHRLGLHRGRRRHRRHGRRRMRRSRGKEGPTFASAIPSGVLQVTLAHQTRQRWPIQVIEGAEIERTARLIMDGTLFVPEAHIASSAGSPASPAPRPTEEAEHEFRPATP